MQEQRRRPRFPVHVAVSFVVEDTPGEGVVYNLSEEGCAIESDQMVPQQGYASAYLSFPGESQPAVVDLARVCWTTRREFGLEFRILSDPARGRIRRFLVRAQAA